MEHFGGAGHSLKIAKNLSKEGRLIGIDRDIEAITKAKEVLQDFDNITYIQDNHDNIKDIIKVLGIKGVDGILLDLGVSSYQLDEKTREYIIDVINGIKQNEEEINKLIIYRMQTLIWEWIKHKN